MTNVCSATNGIIHKIYNIFYDTYGFQNWWPADTKFEVIIGAILTQSTSWNNVELALDNLKRENVFTPQKILEISTEKLESLVRPSGYYKQKAKKILSFLKYFETYNFDLGLMSKKSTQKLRAELLDVWGIGEETADSILCYALDKDILVVDTYTKRLTYRLSLTSEDIKYSNLQKYLMEELSENCAYYKDFHAQIVYHSKVSCTKTPKCENCILKVANLCRYYSMAII